MKKSTLALSVAAALGSLGFVSNALAIGQIAGAGAGSTMAYSADGIGHQLVVPYFTVQGDNATLLNITNTDTVNGKVVKVRFRGAANSDDLFDFQLLMSPGDVWTGSVTQSAAGPALLRTDDTTCTLPAAVKDAAGSQFATGRVDPTPAKGNSANETREGYVEILNMANIPVNTAADSLYTTIKHVAGKPACSATILEAKLGSDYATYAAATTTGQMAAPTGGLTGDWIILNQANTAAWSGSARAVHVVAPAGVVTTGNLLFWPQKFGDPLLATTAAELASQTVTADPILTRQVVKIQQYDLPDMSTPYVAVDGTGAGAAVARADASTSLLAVASVKNQFVTTSDINAVTDFLFSQPTRRYAVAVNYKATSSAANTVTVTGSSASAVYRPSATSAYYTTANTDVVSRQVCLNSLSVPAKDSLFDREEKTPGVGENPFVISPNDPGAPAVFRLCGETAVASINAVSDTAPSALNASVVRNNVLFDAAYTNGWASFNTTNGGLGLPIMGASFIRASNGLVNYGFAWTHKVTRP